jgi:hypothetical protein
MSGLIEWNHIVFSMNHRGLLVFAAIATAILLPIASAFGQGYVSNLGTLIVHVTDSAGRPLVGADVAINSYGCSTMGSHEVTDLGGNVTFSNLNAGGYDVCASLQGYQYHDERVSVVSGETTSASLILLQSLQTSTVPDYTPGIVAGAVVVLLGIIGGLLIKIRSKKHSV